MAAGKKKRYRVKARFYILVTLLLALLVWGGVVIAQTLSPARVEWGRLETDQEVTALLLRDEQVALSQEYARMDCLVAEGEEVASGEELAVLYTSGYSEKDMKNLINLQASIKDYQEINILKAFVDKDLENLNAEIDAKIEQITTLVSQGERRGLLVQERELARLMEERRRYMFETVEADETLNAMYKQEAALQDKINSTKIVVTAAKSGVVSFFLDGYESLLSMDNLGVLDVDTISRIEKELMAGGKVTNAGTDSLVVINQPLYRLVNPNRWYAFIILPRLQNTLIRGGECDISFEGYEETLLTARVYDVAERGRYALVTLELTDPIGALLSLRLVDGHIGRSLEGFKVPAGALTERDGVQGVRVVIDGEACFIAVDVLAQDSRDAIVRETGESAARLALDQKVVIP